MLREGAARSDDTGDKGTLHAQFKGVRQTSNTPVGLCPKPLSILTETLESDDRPIAWIKTIHIKYINDVL